MRSKFLELNGHTILSSLLGAESVVLDVGANRGSFAAAVADRFACHVMALEPTPQLVHDFPSHERVTLLPMALAAQDGTARFYESDNTEASSLISTSPHVRGDWVDVPTITLATLLDRQPGRRADLVKLDIEGAELGILQNITDEVLGLIGQLTVEFHDFAGCYSHHESENCIARVASAGFLVHRHRAKTDDVLFINRQVIGPVRYKGMCIAHALSRRLGF